MAGGQQRVEHLNGVHFLLFGGVRPKEVGALVLSLLAALLFQHLSIQLINVLVESRQNAGVRRPKYVGEVGEAVLDDV